MSRFPRWFVWLLAIGTVGAVVAAGRERILPFAARWLDVGEPPQRSDYVLVLGGGQEIRPFVAAAMVRRGLAGKVLVSHVGPSAEVEDGIVPPEDEVASRVLVAGGIPPSDIFVLGHRNVSTYDEARALAEFLRSSPEARVIIPTHEYHTRRARWVFAQVLGQRAGQISFFSIPTEDFHLETWWRTEEGFCVIVGENLKFLFYQVRYGWWGYGVGAIAMLGGLALYWRARRRPAAAEGRP